MNATSMAMNGVSMAANAVSMAMHGVSMAMNGASLAMNYRVITVVGPPKHAGHPLQLVCGVLGCFGNVHFRGPTHYRTQYLGN